MIRGVVVDTAWFRGNFPSYASVEACAAEGHPSIAELAAHEWTEIVLRSPLRGDAEHCFPVEVARRFTHVRLNALRHRRLALPNRVTKLTCMVTLCHEPRPTAV